jgi:hypothetical protein
MDEKIETNNEPIQVSDVGITENVKIEEKTEQTPNIKEVEKEIIDFAQSNNYDSSDIFVEENDTFDVKVNYYKKDNSLFVENVDTEFDITNAGLKSFTVTFKYPSYLDMQTVHSNIQIASEDQLNLSGLIKMQNTRILVLVRKWSLSDGLEKIDKIGTKFMKAIRVLVMNEIGMEGIM